MICVSIGNIAFEDLEKVLSDLEMLELRLDLLEYSDKEYQAIIDTKKPVIATYRYGSEDDIIRIASLQKLIKLGVEYVDIEIDAKPDFVSTMMAFAKKHQCRTILSYHNFKKTPSHEELQDLIEQSHFLGSDLIKIACLANKESDNDSILSLYRNHKNLIAFCMGEQGQRSRLQSLKLGAEFTYAAISKENITASGQLTYQEMKEMISKNSLQI